MTWTYDDTQPGVMPRDVVRTNIGDVISTRPLVSDEQIAYFLTKNNNDTNLASADAADLAAAIFGNRADKTVGRLSISFSRQQDAFVALAKRLRTRAARLAAVPVAGGLGPTVLHDPERDDYWNVPHNIRPNPNTQTITDV